MAAQEKPSIPSWKQLFDAADRSLGGRINEFARSENFAILTGLATRSRNEVAARSIRSSRQVLHLLNLPAASDVNRLLAQIGLLEREVRELRKQLDDQQRPTLAPPNGSESITPPNRRKSSTPANGREKVANGVGGQSRVRADKHPA